MAQPTGILTTASDYGGADLNTIFAPLYLDGTKNLVNIVYFDTDSTRISLPSTQSGDYSYFLIDNPNASNITYYITTNTNISTSDMFSIICVGGGGSGCNGSGTRISGGGGGGGILFVSFDKSPLLAGTQFFSTIGAKGLAASTTAGTNTTLTNLLTNIVFMQSTGGGVGNVQPPDGSNKGGASGTTTIGTPAIPASYYGTISSGTGNTGGNNSGITPDGNPKSLSTPNTITLPFLIPVPYNNVSTNTLLLSGGGGGNYFASGQSVRGARGGKGLGGNQGSSSPQYGFNYGEPGLTWGAGGGAGGGLSGTGYSGGNGYSGCLIIYWKTRA